MSCPGAVWFGHKRIEGTTCDKTAAPKRKGGTLIGRCERRAILLAQHFAWKAAMSGSWGPVGRSRI